MNALWLLILLPSLGALATSLRSGAIATALARATAAATALLATIIALSGTIGAAAELPWLPERGLRFALRLDPLAIAGILTVAWVTAVAAAHGRGRKLCLLLVGEAAGLVAWLADDLATMVAALSLLALVAAAMVGRSRQSTLAVFLPLSAAAASLTVTALLLGLSHHEASVGQWSLGLGETLGVLSPSAMEIAIAASSTLAALLLAGAWPLHGWWRSAAEDAPTAFGAWSPAVLRPLGVGLLIRVTMPAAAATLAAIAPALALLGGILVLVGLLGVASDRGPGAAGRRHLHLGHLPTGAALLGVATLTPEGISGALLLGLGGGLAFTLAHLLAHPARVGGPEHPLHRLLATIGLLGLLGAPGLLSFAGLLPVGLASLGQGAWHLPAAPALGLLVLSAPLLGLAPLLAALRSPRRPPTTVATSANGPSTPRNHGVLLLTAALLVLLGLAPTLVHHRIGPASSAQSLQVYVRWCSVTASPLLRARKAPESAPEGCEEPLKTLRALARGEEPPLSAREEGVP